MGGYLKRILEVDLETRTTKAIAVEDRLLRDFLGGSGLGARLFLEQVSPEVSPLSGENPLLILTGPLTGTDFPGTSRFSVMAKSPATNMWGEGSCGGRFGAELKFAGWDGIALNKAADRPVYLSIRDNEVEIMEASELWGSDTYQVAELLKEKLGLNARILAIGPAGEKLVKFASISSDKDSYVGRCGLGAVMGSKKLKAIAVQG